MDVFPAFFPLSNASVVVVGDGEAAQAKARLFAHSPAVLVHAPAARARDPGLYEGALLVFLALDDEAVRLDALAAARSAGALVNVVDHQELGDFHTPAIVDRSPLIAAIGTGGAAPMLATLLRNRLEARWPEGLGPLAEMARALQPRVRETLSQPLARRAFWRRVLEGPAAQAVFAGDLDEARRLAEAELAEPAPRGRVMLLQAPARADLLSLAAVRALGTADRIVAEPATGREILAFARREAPRAAAATPAELAAWVQAGEAVLVIQAGPTETLAAELARLGAPVERAPVAGEPA